MIKLGLKLVFTRIAVNILYMLIGAILTLIVLWRYGLITPISN